MVQVLRLEKGHCIKSTCLIENTHVQNRRNCLRENVKNAHVLLYIQIYKPSCNAGSTMSNSKLNTFLQTMQFSTDNYSAPSKYYPYYQLAPSSYESCKTLCRFSGTKKELILKIVLGLQPIPPCLDKSALVGNRHLLVCSGWTRIKNERKF